MSIEFIVEDGTGKSDATSYATVDQYKQYWLNRGLTITDSDALIQGYLNIATDYLDLTYRFLGCRVSSTQALEWPRYGANHKNGTVILSTEIPVEVINAVCYLANKYDMLNFETSTVSSESYGPVSKTYNGKTIEFPVVYKSLRNVLITGVEVVRIN